jgi:hypothetical protein
MSASTFPSRALAAAALVALRRGPAAATALLGSLVLLSSLLLAAGAAHAAEDPPAQACKADKDKFCSATEPGEGRVLVCLRQHADALSPGCQEQLKHLQHCAGQVKAACGGVRGRELRACLKDKADQIDPACRPSRHRA